VACGYTDSQDMTVEIIDLEQPASTCENLANFPYSRHSSIGGLDFDDNPLICSGYEFLDTPQDCLTWRDSSWQNSSSLIAGRGISAWCPTPFPNETHKIIAAGGINKKGIFLILM
jgi:hypothetical protein